MKNNRIFKNIFIIVCFCLMFFVMSAVSFASETDTPTEPFVIIDGNEYYGGEVIDYEITYKNILNNKVNATVTNAIPAYTVYVEGSADNGGEYADGNIVWRLENVDPWASISLEFKVQVQPVTPETTVSLSDEGAKNEFKTDTEIVFEDEPLIVTEDVVTKNVMHIVKAESAPVYETVEDVTVVKDKPTAEPVTQTESAVNQQPEVELKVPDTADNTALIFWLAMLAFSGCAILITLKFKAKLI